MHPRISKLKEKKRKINIDLAILPSHDKEPHSQQIFSCQECFFVDFNIQVTSFLENAIPHEYIYDCMHTQSSSHHLLLASFNFCSVLLMLSNLSFEGDCLPCEDT